MSRYVDGFVIPLPKRNVKEYREMATAASKVWKKYGALEFKECVGDDFVTDHGQSFLDSFAKGEDETVMFSWILFESKEERDRINKLVMDDPAIKDMCGNGEMPFDSKRMLYSGFEVMVDA